MPDSEQPQSARRQYPPIYEKIIPAALIILVGAIIFMLFIIAAVVIGVFPGAG